MLVVQRIRRVWNQWNLLLTICFAFFVYNWTWQKQDPIMEILGGIPDYGGKNIELVPLGKWLFLFAFFLFIVCKEIQTDLKIRKFKLYRYQNFMAWWREHFFSIHFTNGIAFLIAYLIWAGLGEMNMQLAAALTFFLHLSSMVSILLAVDYISTVKLAPGILIVAEGVGYVLSVNYDIPWLACGMYNRSVFVRTDGFWIGTLVAEVVVTVICFLAVPVLWKKDILERKEN
ncbi:MAG: hypothetical protein HDR01_05045 [Lachnospiraceae bacterium]|nr:hypothetical protein [Lachnospiraceae bacterium]